MSVEVKVPQAGESITEVLLGDWRKGEGEAVSQDEVLVELESDKATVELPAPSGGTITSILKKAGDTAAVGEVIAYIDESGDAPAADDGKSAQETKKPSKEVPEPKAKAEAAPAPKDEEACKPEPEPESPPEQEEPKVRPMPAAQRLIAQYDIRASDVTGTGPGGRILKQDVLRHIEAQEAAAEDEIEPGRKAAPEVRKPEPAAAAADERGEDVRPMSPMRKRIAERLVTAQREAALLTTFNEIDMSAVIALRKTHQDAFKERHGIKLGFMSFFVKAAVEALKQFPQVNAFIRGEEIVYHNYYDIGIAVGGGKGLVVPVLRNAERMSFADIELAIADLGRRAAENKIKLEELQGGTFSITNGGIYGSLLSTPIVNPPQSGILGMHAIQERPVAHEGQVVIRPMMYVALTYDHRLVDGREAVTFLRRIKECIEAPARMLIEA